MKFTKNKKIVYVVSFTFLGILLQFLIHEILEVWYVGLLLVNFEKYNLGLSWDGWFLIHHIGSVILLIMGIAFGFWQGMFWWPRVYKNRK